MARSLKELVIPAQRPAAPHRHQPRGVEGIDHQDHDRQIQERKPQRQRGDIEAGQARESAHHQSAPPAAAAAAGHRAAGATSSTTSSTIAAAEATGQSLLVKNSSHSVWPIISELEPAKQIRDHEFADDGMKHSSTPAPTPGSDSGNVTSQNACHGGAPRSLGRLQQRRLHLGQRRVERQDHERQVGIDDAEIHRAVGGEPHHRRRYQVQRQQDLLSRPSCCRMLIQA